MNRREHETCVHITWFLKCFLQSTQDQLFENQGVIFFSKLDKAMSQIFHLKTELVPLRSHTG